MLAAFNVWLKIDQESCEVIDKVVGMLHNASLLYAYITNSLILKPHLNANTMIYRIDDIQDASPLRRGSPSAHCIFGIPQSINAANYAYFLAQKELLKLPNAAKASIIFNEELVNLHRGQGMELFWRDTLTVPTEQEYYRMISNKTGGLFRLMTRLMQNLSATAVDVQPLTELLGLIFQIRDDLNNLCSEEVNKSPSHVPLLILQLRVLHASYSDF